MRSFCSNKLGGPLAGEKNILRHPPTAAYLHTPYLGRLTPATPMRTCKNLQTHPDLPGAAPHQGQSFGSRLLNSNLNVPGDHSHRVWKSRLMLKLILDMETQIQMSIQPILSIQAIRHSFQCLPLDSKPYFAVACAQASSQPAQP